MGERGKKILRPLAGFDTDTAKELLPETKATYLKNAINNYNRTGVASSDGNNHNAGLITPVQSNISDATFNACISTYTWDMSGTTFPRRKGQITIDGIDYTDGNSVDGNAEATIYDLLTWLNSLNLGIFSVDGTNIVISNTTIVYGDITTQDSDPRVNDPITVTPTVETVCASDGTNICIGSKFDRRLNQFFWFNWNSLGNHNFWVYDANTNIADVITIEPLFNFSLRDLITSIDIVLADVSTDVVNVQNVQRLVYWTDGNNPPYKINVDKALAGGYAGLSNLRTPDEYFLRVKYPPLDVNIAHTLTNPDTTYELNWIANKEFQFKARYYYDDGEYTTTGATSTLYYSVNTDLNFVELNIGAGSSLVKRVELLFKETNAANLGDWKSFDNILRSDIILNTTYPYNSTTNIFTYQFFNNNQYNIVDQSDAERPYNFVPLKTDAQEYVETNVLIDGNILEGYNNLTKEQIDTPSVQVTYTDYAPLTLTLTGNINYSYTGVAGGGDNFVIDVIRVDAQTGEVVVEDFYTVLLATPSPLDLTASPTVITDIDINDVVYLKISQLNVAGGVSVKFDVGSILIGTYTNIPVQNSCGTGDFNVARVSTSQTMVVNDHLKYNSIVTDDCSTWSLSLYQHTCPNYAKGWSQLKQGGSYKIDFICYDAALRSTYVQHSDSRLTNIETEQQNSKFQFNQLTFLWNDLVLPDWVKYVKVCRTKNLVIDRSVGTGYLQLSINFDNGSDATIGFVDYDGTVTAAPTSTTTKVKFKIQNIIDYNTTYFENTTTTYTWTKGDRVQFIRNGNGTWFDFATYGLIDKELSTDPAAPDVTFLCDYEPSLATLADGAQVQLYTPNKQAQTDIYYEISDFIPTTGDAGNNKVSVSSTVLNTWDTYPAFWDTPFADSSVTDEPFEHHSIYLQGTAPSNGEDIGRINVVNETARQLWYPARLRKSSAYLPSTFINGLSTNIGGDYKDYNRAKGGIVQLHSDGYKLLALQEDDTFIVMMAKQLVTYAQGTSQLITADQFFSDPLVMDGNFGCQNSESFQDWERYMRWVDVKRGAVVECDWQNVKDIAREGMIKSYTENKFKYIYDYNANEHTNQTCCFDFSDLVFSISAPNIIGIQINGVYKYYPLSTDIDDIDELLTFFNNTVATDTFVIHNDTDICVTDGNNSYGNFVIYNPSTSYTWTLPFFGGGAMTKYTIGIYVDAVLNVQTFTTGTSEIVVADVVAWLNTLGVGTFSNDGNDVSVDSCTTFGDIDVWWVNHYATDPLSPDEEQSASTATGTQLCSIVYQTSMVCNVDKFIVPSVIDPKNDQYILTTFNQLTKASYYWNVEDFTTSETAETISINIDGAVQSTTAIVADISDVIDALNGLSADTFKAIENGNVIYLISSSESVYTDLVIGETTYNAQTDNKYSYINNEYQFETERNETIAYAFNGNVWSTLYAFTPEFYVLTDGHKKGLAFSSFKEGTPYFHNIKSTTTYDTFYGTQTDQVITLATSCDSPATEKRYMSICLDSRNLTSAINSPKYDGYKVLTSDNLESKIPLPSFVFRENMLWSNFYRSTSYGGTLQSGMALRGTFIEISLVRDTSIRTEYSEFAKCVIFFLTSEKSIK